MKLAVVIPTLNEAAHVEALVRRLLNGLVEGSPSSARNDASNESASPLDPTQAVRTDVADWIVVADGGSDDSSVAQVQALIDSMTNERATSTKSGATSAPRLQLIQAPRGRGPQMRVGAERVMPQLGANDLIVFVHADNLPLAGALAALRAAAVAEPDVPAFAMQQVVDGDGEFYRKVERYAVRRAAKGRVYGDSCLAVRAGIYAKIGGIRPIRLFEDLDLSRRVFREGPIRMVPDARVRVHARRWKQEGRTIVVIRNWLLTRAFELGIPPNWLARFYPRHSGLDS